MAEVLPTSIHRRWTSDAPKRRKTGLLTRRLRVGLVLASVALVLAGASAGLFAWWQPLSKPALILLTSSPQGTVTIERQLAIQNDGAAIADIILPKSHLLINDGAPTRAELLHYVNMLRLARSHDHLLLLVSSSAGLSSAGEVVLYTADAGPSDPDNAIRLCDLLDAIGECRSDGTLVLLDIVPASQALLTRVPPEDLAACVDVTLRNADLGRAAVLTSHSPGERANLLAVGNHTLFGWLAATGLLGAADGAANTLPDGRVSSIELLNYLQQQVPELAAKVAGQPQRPCLYGETGTFDLAVHSRDNPALAIAAKYPAWLEAEWGRYLAARDSVDDATDQQWAAALQEVELLALVNTVNTDAKSLQQRLKAYRPVMNSTGASVPLSAAVEQFLADRRQVISSAPAGQAKGAEQKLLATFAKAQASQSTSDLITACIQVAAKPEHGELDEWQALLGLIDLRKTLPGDNLLVHWRALAALRQQFASDASIATGAQYSLRVALTCEQVVNCRESWPWLQTMADQMLDARVHGDALLLARGFASANDALSAQQRAHERAQQLAAAAASIQAHLQGREQNRRFITSHTYLAEQDSAATQSWVQAVQALRRLELLLATPARPWQNDIELRAWLGELASASTSIDSSLVSLRGRFSGVEVANIIAACNQNDADAADLIRARQLLKSTELSPQQRSAVWCAYLPKALNLQTAATTPLKPASDPIDLAALAERRESMFAAWQQYAQTNRSERNSAADSEAIATAYALWQRDWQRFHQEELTRVTSPEAPPVWSSTLLDVVGPFSCDTLRPNHPAATFELQWSQRHEADPPPVVTALSPSSALSVTVQSGRNANTSPAQFKLNLHDSPTNKFADAGFLAVLASGGRRHHTPVILPAATDTAEIDIMLSNSATQLTPLDKIALAGRQTTVFAWLENNTSAAQQVSLRWQNGLASPPIPLAAHEVRCVPLTPPGGAQSATSLSLTVQDVATQRELAERTFAFVSPTASDVIRVSSARVAWDPARGALLQVEVTATDELHSPVGVVLTPLHASSLKPLVASAGTTRLPLSSEQTRGALSAVFPPLRLGETVRCEVAVEGLPEPLRLAGTFPASGESANLFPVTSAELTISGEAIAQPSPNYLLTVTPSHAAHDSQLQFTLRSASDQSIVLSRQVPAAQPPAATIAVSTPPGGLLLSPIVVPPTQSFNTSGLAGRFIWQANIVAEGKMVASAEQEVIFDNTPPTACRFVNPPSMATKNGVVALQVAGWDDLTDVTDVKLFVGQPKDAQPPPGAQLIPAHPAAGDSTIWRADLPTPAELGPCTIGAVLTNAAGLATVISTQLQIVDALPPEQGEIDGVVVEGTLAQAGLEVTLEKTPGATLMTTKTDAAGKFHFDKVPVGSYTLRSNKIASQRKGAAHIKVDAGAKASAMIRLAL